jgi:hypothetical protein
MCISDGEAVKPFRGDAGEGAIANLGGVPSAGMPHVVTAQKHTSMPRTPSPPRSEDPPPSECTCGVDGLGPPADDTTTPSKPTEEEDKRQARLERNREAAQQSRQRKRSQLQEAERRAGEFARANAELHALVQRLAHENHTLRVQLSVTAASSAAAADGKSLSPEAAAAAAAAAARTLPVPVLPLVQLPGGPLPPTAPMPMQPPPGQPTAMMYPIAHPSFQYPHPLQPHPAANPSTTLVPTPSSSGAASDAATTTAGKATAVRRTAEVSSGGAPARAPKRSKPSTAVAALLSVCAFLSLSLPLPSPWGADEVVEDGGESVLGLAAASQWELSREVGGGGRVLMSLPEAGVVPSTWSQAVAVSTPPEEPAGETIASERAPSTSAHLLHALDPLSLTGNTIHTHSTSFSSAATALARASSRSLRGVNDSLVALPAAAATEALREAAEAATAQRGRRLAGRRGLQTNANKRLTVPSERRKAAAAEAGAGPLATTSMSPPAALAATNSTRTTPETLAAVGSSDSYLLALQRWVSSYGGDLNLNTGSPTSPWGHHGGGRVGGGGRGGGSGPWLGGGYLHPVMCTEVFSFAADVPRDPSLTRQHLHSVGSAAAAAEAAAGGGTAFGAGSPLSLSDGRVASPSTLPLARATSDVSAAAGSVAAPVGATATTSYPPTPATAAVTAAGEPRVDDMTTNADAPRARLRARAAAAADFVSGENATFDGRTFDEFAAGDEATGSGMGSGGGMVVSMLVPDDSSRAGTTRTTHSDDTAGRPTLSQVFVMVFMANSAQYVTYACDLPTFSA